MKRSAPIRRSLKPLRKTRLNPISPKRKKDLTEYLNLRSQFLKDHPYCQVTIALLQLSEEGVIQWKGLYGTPLGNLDHLPQSTDIHHTAGRSGKNYLDTSTWLAVCRAQHERIHKNPSWARSLGFLK